MQFFEKSETPKNEVSVIETETADAKEVIDVTIFDDLLEIHQYIKKFLIPKLEKEYGYGDLYTLKANDTIGKIKSPDDFDNAKEYLENGQKKYLENLAQGKSISKQIFIFDNSLGLGKEKEGCQLAKVARNLYPEGSQHILLIGNTSDREVDEGYIMLNENVDIMFKMKPIIHVLMRAFNEKPDLLRRYSDSNAADMEKIISTKWKKMSTNELTNNLADNELIDSLRKISLSM